MEELEQLDQEVVSCRRCTRLAAWREQVAEEKKRAYRHEEYWGRPLPGFGHQRARLLIIGLAPAAHGGNRTGRMFTGDSSADTLFIALHAAGFASQPTSRRRDDGLALCDAYITAAVRCAPPGNRPTPEEMRACQPFLERNIALLPAVEVVVALGAIAFAAYLRFAARQVVALPCPLPLFGHGLSCRLDARGPLLIASYHPSRQNTQTGRLTQAMLNAVFMQARETIDHASHAV